MRKSNKCLVAFVLFLFCIFVMTQAAGCTGIQSENTNPTALENSNAEVLPKKSSMLVYFLDVGQGNAVLIENNGEFMLIDGGDRDYSSFVVSYLKKLGVSKIEYLISSHYDSDHLNGLIGALHTFDVSTVLDADYKTDTKVYHSFVKAVKKENALEIHPAAGEVYELGNAVITVACPASYNNADENDNSIGVRIVYGSTSFLICGDAGTEAEEQMLDSGEELESTVYMCSHHGSKTASSEAFLSAVNPEYAIISAGAGNPYGHPDEEVMERLKKQDIEIFRTDEQGTIIAESNGKNIKWNVDVSDDYCSGAEVSERLTEKKTKIESNKEDENSKKELTYILNTSTKKIHLSNCKYVDDISDKNRKEVTTSIEELEREGYSPCKVCMGELFW